MYKISINFEPRGKLISTSAIKSQSNLEIVMDMAALRGTSNRVLFQNVEGNINMGVWFNDPDVEMEDICWYNVLAKDMYVTKDRVRNHQKYIEFVHDFFRDFEP